jgi:hypothetical protein
MTPKQKKKVELASKGNAELKLAIRLNCFECQGYLADGFADCNVTNCPLYKFRLTRGNLSCKKFTIASKALKLSRKEHLGSTHGKQFPQPSTIKN